MSFSFQRRSKLSALSFLLSLAAGVAGGAGWTTFHDQAVEKAAKNQAKAEAAVISTIRSDPTACNHLPSPAAGPICEGLSTIDEASAFIVSWSQPQDQAAVKTVLDQVRQAALMKPAPSWAPALAFSTDRVLETAALLADSKTVLSQKPEGDDKVALSGNLAKILSDSILAQAR
jgi:hypothetical protein